jgi:hypothetical protein
MMEAVNAFETSVNFYETARHKNPEDSHLLVPRRENLVCLKMGRVSVFHETANFPTGCMSTNTARKVLNSTALFSVLDTQKSVVAAATLC